MFSRIYFYSEPGKGVFTQAILHYTVPPLLLRAARKEKKFILLNDCEFEQLQAASIDIGKNIQLLSTLFHDVFKPVTW
jgi:hypothetical protein